MRIFKFQFGFLLLAISLLGLASFAPAQVGSQPHPKEKIHSWNWLSEADQARLMQSIPAAPAPGSAIDRADLAEVLKMQAARTPQDIAEAMDDRHFNVAMVAKALGPDFTKENFPLTFALLNHGLEDEAFLDYRLKEQYRRPRPFQEHAEVKPLFHVEQFSYPSGHSCGAHTMANILSEVFPAHQADLQARAEAVGRSRVVAGVHYPSDVTEGAALAKALTDALLANPNFQKDLAAARAEVAARKSKL